MRKIFLLLATAIISFACEKNSALVKTEDTARQIELTARFRDHQVTRIVTEDPTDKLLGIFKLAGENYGSQEELFNLPFEMGRNADCLYPKDSRNALYLPQKGSQARLIAYSPYRTEVNKVFHLDITDQLEEDCQLYYTILPNKVGYKDDKVKLELFPVLPKINVFLKDENHFNADGLNGASVIIKGLSEKGQFNLTTGILIASSVPTEMQFELEDATHSVSFLQLPAAEMEEAAITVLAPKSQDPALREASYKLSEYLTDGCFKVGYMYDFNFTFKGGKLLFDVNEMPIANWEEGDNIIIRIPEEDIK